MGEQEYKKIILALLEKITRLENDAWIKEHNNECLRKENERLNKLLTPTAKVGADNE